MLTGIAPILGLVLLLLTSLLLMSDATEGSARFGQLYSVLLVINVVGLVVLAGLIGWNVAQLASQVRRKRPGAGLTLRMVALFTLLAVTPLLVVYYFSVQFLNRGIDSWFDVRVDRALQDSLELSRAALGLRMRELHKRTRQVATEIGAVPDDKLSLAIEDGRSRISAYELTLTDANGKTIAFSNVVPSAIVPETPGDTVLTQLRQGGDYIGLDPIGEDGSEGLFMRVVLSVSSASAPAETRVLQALFPVSERLSNLADSVQSAYRQYTELAYLRKPLKRSFTLTLSLVLLLSLFTAVWAAFFSARRVVAPLRDLAEGTRAVASGEYETQLPAGGSDEVGFLVSSFNDMTRRLAEARDTTRLSQHQAESQRTYVEAVLARLSTGVLTLDDGLRIHTANDAAADILGVNFGAEPGLAIGQWCDHHPHLAPLGAALARHLIESDELDWRDEIVLFGEGGSRNLMLSGTRLRRVGSEPGELHRRRESDRSGEFHGRREFDRSGESHGRREFDRSGEFHGRSEFDRSGEFRGHSEFDRSGEFRGHSEFDRSGEFRGRREFDRSGEFDPLQEHGGFTEEGFAENVVVFDDITALIQAQRNAAWSEVARRLAHEIKNPLTPIQLSAERLRHKYLGALHGVDDGPLDRLTRTIVAQVEAMKGMVNAFSEYARMPAMRAAPLDLNALVLDVVELYQYEQHGQHGNQLHDNLRVTAAQDAHPGQDAHPANDAHGYEAHAVRPLIETHLDDTLPNIEADADRLRQVLHNLIKNAKEAVKDDNGARRAAGSTHIDTSIDASTDASTDVHRPPVRITTRWAKRPKGAPPAIEILVSDRGPGFDGEVVERVFEPYVTTKPKGSGLGLAIVQKIVEEHGGRVWAENPANGGARVVIRMGLALEPVERRRTGWPAAAQVASGNTPLHESTPRPLASDRSETDTDTTTPPRRRREGAA
ncbi:MAG: sensor histidine kinase [Gammaproteobacteria bacterium]